MTREIMDYHCSMCGWRGWGKKLTEDGSCPKCGSEEVDEIDYHGADKIRKEMEAALVKKSESYNKWVDDYVQEYSKDIKDPYYENEDEVMEQIEETIQTDLFNLPSKDLGFLAKSIKINPNDYEEHEELVDDVANIMFENVKSKINNKKSSKDLEAMINRVVKEALKE